MGKTAAIEIPAFNGVDVERCYARAIEHQRTRQYGASEAGMRLARQKHPKLLLALERAAEILEAQAQEQFGRTMRDHATPFSHRVNPTEASLFREAYRLCDEGTPIGNLQWIYAQAAWLAGLHY